MYRKVHNTMLAFSVTGVLLLVGLMAGIPSAQAPQPQVRTVRVGPLIVQVQAASRQSAEARAEAIAARAEALETRIEAATSTAEALSDVAAFAAGVAAESIFLAAAFAGEIEIPAADGQVNPADERQNQRRHVRRAREALALPYFSFAQGLRRNRS